MTSHTTPLANPGAANSVAQSVGVMPVASRWRRVSRAAMVAALALFALLAAVWITTFVIAAQPQSLDARVHDVASQLRCPSCNGETVADASTPVANQMRAVIRQKLAAGESEQQVLADFRASYGDSILASPPLSGFTLVIWIGPILMLLAGIAVVALAAREWRTPVVPAPNAPLAATPTDADEREQLRAVLLRELAAEEGLPLTGRGDEPSKGTHGDPHAQEGR